MSSIVKINDTELKVIEFQGQRVATLAQIDEVHERPEGTARKRYNDNRERFVQGEDFFVRNSDEAREMGFIAPNGLILMTEQGYLMLVKSFTDDLAWQVQRQLVNGYFRGKKAATLEQPSKPARASVRYREAAAITGAQLKICKLLGVDEGMAKVIAAKEVKAVTGLDYTNLLTTTAATDNPRMTPKELAALIGAGATSEQVNNALEQLSFQAKERWMNGKGQPRSKWVLTELGKEYGALVPYQAVEHQHSGYRPAWHARVIELIRPLVEVAIAQRTAPKPRRDKKTGEASQRPASQPQMALP
ncbi:ORF6N domain-containing protein [Delftia sp. PE138]|uniref:ORF6N domain-containing protein n=1 Tax=Delftia sp. PE138 TaxID=1812483 RepID=UPI001BB06BAB|nr:ORF6N domain-containing protein [Delftia sp. PE138]MBS3719409.1 hypothetical protein [Delftia sp. PE138]